MLLLLLMRLLLLLLLLLLPLLLLMLLLLWPKLRRARVGCVCAVIVTCPAATAAWLVAQPMKPAHRIWQRVTRLLQRDAQPHDGARAVCDAKGTSDQRGARVCGSPRWRGRAGRLEVHEARMRDGVVRSLGHIVPNPAKVAGLHQVELQRRVDAAAQEENGEWIGGRQGGESTLAAMRQRAHSAETLGGGGSAHQRCVAEPRVEVVELSVRDALVARAVTRVDEDVIRTTACLERAAIRCAARAAAYVNAPQALIQRAQLATLCQPFGWTVALPRRVRRHEE